MSLIRSIATAVPEYRVTAGDVYQALATIWPAARHLPALLEDASRTRYLVDPVERLLDQRSIGEREASYRFHARRLARQAAREALERAELDAACIDLIVCVSCTGFMIPSLDVFLADDLGLRADVVRVPVSAWGCAGGAAALARAHDWLRAYPHGHALVVAVELPSVTFQSGDPSKGNLLSALVFGDGAAAAALTGEDHGGLRIVEASEVLLPNTTGALGFDLRDGGFYVVLDRELPRTLEALLPTAVQPVLEGWDLRRPSFASVHAGGSRILGAVRLALQLSDDVLANSWATFRDYGNISSASILFALQAELPPAPPGLGLALGLGPGITAQLLKLAR
jgi:1,3,6,8-tetrahydroxynaphthalene synthase